jgi:excisionase family DNA binding protein
MKSIYDKIPELKELDLLAERLTTGGVNDPQQIDFCWFIRSACRRPKMYVGKQSFELLATFLSGYDHALDRGQARPRSWGLSEFGHWLVQQLNLSSSLGWERMMMKSFPDETEAFARLPQLYEKFLLHQANTLADKELGKKPEIKRDTLYTYDEVATLTSVTRKTIERAVENGNLKTDHMGSEPRICGAAILQWLDAGGKTGRSRRDPVEEA